MDKVQGSALRPGVPVPRTSHPPPQPVSRETPRGTRPPQPSNPPPPDRTPTAAAPRGVAPAGASPANPRLALLPALLLIGITLAGAPYYLLSPAGRVRHAWHAWLRPSGYLGQAIGVVAFLLFLFLWLYPLRKRVRWLAFTGGLARWLDVHVAAGLLVPLAGAVHAGWRFRGLIGLGYAAMLVVAISGVVGRYLYVRIPRHKNGLELSREEAVARRRELITEIAAATGLDPRRIEATLAPAEAGETSPGLAGTILQMLRDDVARRRMGRQLAAEIRATRPAPLDRRTLRAVLGLARRETALAQQIRLYEATHRLFRFWHAAHQPVAISALVAVVLHVIVVVAVGATWFW